MPIVAEINPDIQVQEKVKRSATYENVELDNGFTLLSDYPDVLNNNTTLDMVEYVNKYHTLNIEYESFYIKEPNFVSREDKELFYFNDENIENLGPSLSRYFLSIFYNCLPTSYLWNYWTHRNVPLHKFSLYM